MCASQSYFCVIKYHNVLLTSNILFLQQLGIPRIEIAEALYSQFDAQLGGNSSAADFGGLADCTHYCNPSNVFTYVHMIILNNLLQRFD